MHELSASDYESWKLYYKEEPFGNPWQNWLMAMQTNIIARAHFKREHRPKFTDYFYEDPDYKRERQTQDLFLWFQSKAKH